MDNRIEVISDFIGAVISVSLVSGGPVGGRLRRFIKKNQFKTFELDKKYIEEDFYMDLDEDFTERLAKAKEKTA